MAERKKNGERYGLKNIGLNCLSVNYCLTLFREYLK